MLFASPATWGRLIRERGWLRPRARIHPATPKEGIRNQAQRILAHRRDRHPVARRNSTLPARRDRQLLPTHPRAELAARLEPESTCAILSTAGAGLDLSRNP